MIFNLILYAGLTISLYTDNKYHKIKNFVVFPMMACGIFLNFFFYGLEGLKHSLLSLIITFILVSFTTLTGMLGYGDKKMFCAIACLLGLKFSLSTFILSFICMFFYMCIIHPVKTFQIFKNLFLYLYRLLFLKSADEYDLKNPDWIVPYANFIFAGTVITHIIIELELI